MNELTRGIRSRAEEIHGDLGKTKRLRVFVTLKNGNLDVWI